MVATTIPTSTPTHSHTEAPASWNVRYRVSGYDCTLTLRGESGKDLLDKAAAALKWLEENGAQASGYSPKAETTKPQGSPDEAEKGYCPIHKVQMTRFTKENRVWYSHKLEDGSWCKGK
jgi:hypothetical protein